MRSVGLLPCTSRTTSRATGVCGETRRKCTSIDFVCLMQMWFRKNPSHIVWGIMPILKGCLHSSLLDRLVQCARPVCLTCGCQKRFDSGISNEEKVHLRAKVLELIREDSQQVCE